MMLFLGLTAAASEIGSRSIEEWLTKLERDDIIMNRHFSPNDSRWLSIFCERPLWGLDARSMR